jgi:hypothetical protein
MQKTPEKLFTSLLGNCEPLAEAKARGREASSFSFRLAVVLASLILFDI